MTKAADIIAALLTGKHAPVVERSTGMPYGWALWLRGLQARLGIIERGFADAIVHALAQREPVMQGRSRPLNRWQAARSLFYQDWDPPLREERGLRWFAAVTSVLMHLLFALLLALFALVNLPPPPAASEETRVQVEFVGQGTPEDEGGGPPATEAAAEPASAAQAPAQASAAEPSAAPPSASPAPQDQVEQPAAVQQQQNVQVTETPEPTIEFVLPPTTARVPQLAPPQLRPQEIGVPVREVTVVQLPPTQKQPPRPEIAVPQPSQQLPEVRQREVAAPLSPIRTVQLPSRPIAAPQVRSVTPGLREREIPAPNRQAAASASGAGSAPSAAPGGAREGASASQGTQPAGRSSGSGATAATRPGATPSPTRGDDWGDSDRNRAGSADGSGPGQGPGLFNADGSVRVPSDATGTASRPGAPGSKQAQRADADRASKWLERPDFPYEPTMFDKYWRPTDESLLGEWVRRAIREVEIPIPGTSKRVKCVVSVLQAGGACSLFDPNLNEQPATARPPPDIPVKRNPIPTDS